MMTNPISIEDAHEYIGRRGKCAKPVPPITRRRHDPWYDHKAVPGRYSRDEQRRRARRACCGCPVQQECLLVALALETEAGACWGYWGGTIPRTEQQCSSHAQAAQPISTTARMPRWPSSAEGPAASRERGHGCGSCSLPC